MALFSRRKNVPADAVSSAAAAEESPESAASADLVTDSSAPGENVPQVNISMSSFGGLGVAPSAPQAEPAPAAQRRVVAESNHNADGTVALPFAPDEPPTDWETAPGLRDNAVLRDALSRLPEDPSTPELLGVVRQLLQGHLFLRVKGDAREQVEAGQELQLAVLRDGDRNFLLAFSSGRALQQAVLADGDTDTSSFGQPSVMVLRHALDGEFSGIILDNASGQARVVVPRELIERVMGESDPEFRLKTLLAADRTEETIPAVVAALGVARVWAAIGVAGEENGEPVHGVAEAHTAGGERYLQLFTHPLEVVALGRDEQPAPFTTEQLLKALREHTALAGVLIDAAGPNLRVSREQLASLIAE